MEATDGVFGGDVGEARRVGGRGFGVGYDFYLHAGGVGEGEDFFVEAAGAAGELDELLDEAVFPEGEGVGGDAEGGVGDFAGASGAAAYAGPWEEGEDGAGGAEVVAEVEVVGAGVVEVDGALDEAEAEALGVEVEVRLRVGGDGGDMVETDDGMRGHVGDLPGLDSIVYQRGWWNRG